MHLCKHKIQYSFDHCDCIVFRLYAKLLSTHGPNLAYCAIFLNELVKIVNIKAVFSFLVLYCTFHSKTKTCK